MRLILILTALLAFQSSAASEFDEMKALAEQGDARAQYNLGFMYATGEGVPENDAEAVKWFRKAADQGLANARLICFIKPLQGCQAPHRLLMRLLVELMGSW